MSGFAKPIWNEHEFSGVARLFPLPGLVMFPHVVQALHIFEPRYRNLLEDSLDSDQLIGLAVPCATQEANDPERPVLESTICLTKVVSHTPLPDGCSNILVIGLRRARLIEELPQQHGYREARVQLLDELFDPGIAADRNCQFRALVEAASRIATGSGEQIPPLMELLGDKAGLGVLTDLLAYSLETSVNLKIRLLAESNVDARAGLILRELRRLATRKRCSGRREFPPTFSHN